MEGEGFERAVASALDMLGTGVLDRPREFVGAVSDLYDPDSPELTVLYAHGDDRLLHPYALAASQRSTQALAQAAQRAERYLHDMRRVTSADSRAVAWGIAVGVAAHLGVKAPDSPEDERIRREEERRRLEQNERARREEECRRLEEERRRREEEERRRLDEERRRQEESRARLEREEAARKAAEDAARKAEEAKSKSRNRAGAVALAAIACLIVAIAVASGNHSGTTADLGTGSASASEIATPATSDGEDDPIYSYIYDEHDNPTLYGMLFMHVARFFGDDYKYGLQSNGYSWDEQGVSLSHVNSKYWSVVGAVDGAQKGIDSRELTDDAMLKPLGDTHFTYFLATNTYDTYAEAEKGLIDEGLVEVEDSFEGEDKVPFKLLKVHFRGDHRYLVNLQTEDDGYVSMIVMPEEALKWGIAATGWQGCTATDIDGVYAYVKETYG